MRLRQRSILAAATTLAALVATGAAAQTPAVYNARLDGAFDMAGYITTAVNVRGEHRGGTFSRVWTFTSHCTSGQCATVRLDRHRAHGVDKVILFRRKPGFYRGTASFFAPLRCGNHTNPRGQQVLFTIKVWITQADLVNGQNTAVRIRATYTNRHRINLTRCVAVLGHDAARYQGDLVPPPPPPPPPTERAAVPAPTPSAEGTPASAPAGAPGA